MRIVLALVVLGACGFSGTSGSGRDGSVEPDAPPVEACDPLTLRYSINGGPELVDVNPEPMLLRLGDSVVIDGTQTCGREGAPEFSWRIPAAFAGDTDNAVKRAVRIAPIAVGTHLVDLEIRDSVDIRTLQLEVNVRGIEYLPYIDPNSNDDDCDGLALTTGNLFVVCNAGIHQVDLADPHAPGAGNFYPSPPSAPSAMNRIAVESDEILWLIDSGVDDRVFRYNVTDGQLDELENTVTTVSGDPRRLAPRSGGVRVATNDSVWSTDDSGASWVQESMEDSEMVAENDGDLWSGDERLVHASDGDALIDVFPGDDDNIRSMIFAGDDLWVGGEEGAARIRNAQIDKIYTTADNLRDMAVDPIFSGDVWAGSNGDGLYRYSAALDEWLRFSGEGVGLTNGGVEAVVVDSSGGRDAVYMATNTGLFVLTTSFTAPTGR